MYQVDLLFFIKNEFFLRLADDDRIYCIAQLLWYPKKLTGSHIDF